MISWGKFATAKSLCSSFSGSIFKWAVGLDVMCHHISCNLADVVFVTQQQMFWVGTSRPQGTQHTPPISKSSSLFCVADAVEQGRKHIVERKEKVYNTSLAIMSTLFHLVSQLHGFPPQHHIVWVTDSDWFSYSPEHSLINPFNWSVINS